MKPFKFFLLVSLFALFSFSGIHKYYVSITQIEYVKEKQSVQIISRIFVDDIEKLIRKRYDEKVTLNDGQDEAIIDSYLKKYLLQKTHERVLNTHLVKTLAQFHRIIHKKFCLGIYTP